MSISQDVFVCHNEINALKSIQQTNLYNLQYKYSYSTTKTFTFSLGTRPQTQEKEAFPKRFKFIFTPEGNQKTFAIACCEITSFDGEDYERDAVNISQNIDSSNNVSWDFCFLGSFKKNSDSVAATVTFRASCLSLGKGSVSLTEY